MYGVGASEYVEHWKGRTRELGLAQRGVMNGDKDLVRLRGCSEEPVCLRFIFMGISRWFLHRSVTGAERAQGGLVQLAHLLGLTYTIIALATVEIGVEYLASRDFDS